MSFFPFIFISNLKKYYLRFLKLIKIISAFFQISKMSLLVSNNSKISPLTIIISKMVRPTSKNTKLMSLQPLLIQKLKKIVYGL